jgi:VWFA-related protein
VSRHAAVAAVLLLALAGASPGQQPVFRTGVDVLRLDVLVTDGGRPIRGLTAADFEVLDNGAPQRVEVVPADRVPLDVALVLDVSQSVQGEVLAHLKRAARAVTDALDAKDRVALWTFSHRVSQFVAPTGDRAIVRSAIDAMAPGGATSLLDAIYAALMARAPSPNRPVALVFSDGRDNRSWLAESDVIDAAQASETVIYAVTFTPKPAPASLAAPAVDVGPDESLLGALADGSGGRVLRTVSEQELGPRFLDVLDETRTRYVLTYALGPNPTPGWHRLTVRLTRRTGQVRARAGYQVVPGAPRG